MGCQCHKLVLVDVKVRGSKLSYTIKAAFASTPHLSHQIITLHNAASYLECCRQNLIVKIYPVQLSKCPSAQHKGELSPIKLHKTTEIGNRSTVTAILIMLALTFKTNTSFMQI